MTNNLKMSNTINDEEINTIKDEDIYTKKSQLEHILLRPDTYVGSTENNKILLWIYDELHKLKKIEINSIDALFKIYDEVLVNASDNSQNDKTMEFIKVYINEETNEIQISNDGVGIPVTYHTKEKCYIPELIFGHFLTGSNFDDTKKRTTGGRNGYGAKLTNAFSKEFEVYIEDSKNNKTFKQIYKNNMSERTEPEICDKKIKKGLVQIRFIPDFKYFKLEDKFTPDIINLFKKRIYDISATTYNKIKVYLNDELIKEKSFMSYISLYYPDNENIIYEKVNKSWEIAIIYIPDNNFEQISFVNSINTYQGGTHVKYISDMILKKLEAAFKKKYKDTKFKPQMFKDNLVLFINCLIDKPQFSSQSKEQLISKPSKFGSECEISDKIIKKLISFGILEQVFNFIKLKEELNIKKKTDGKKLSNIKGIPKLEDANWAGTNKSTECCLIVTEGDSAKALAMSGRTVVGNDKFGVFPLKGKLLNIREATAKQQLENAEIKNLKKIIGLQKGKEYTEKNISELRYRYIMIFTDQDNDGFHIKGLVMNWLHYEWPSLLQLDFIKSLSTPIVRAKKKKTIKDFYNEPDYIKWCNKINTKSWHIKYYKGLGTSNSTEAKEYFTDLNNKLINYKWDTSIIDEINLTDKYIKLAFEKQQADNRKKWLEDKQNTSLDYNNKNINFSDFINQELKLFSYADLERSIPNIVDGFKPSIRKILYACFLRKLNTKKDEIKVSQLAGYVSDKTNYHHGENSLYAAIVNMAQNYVGSNNINLLYPSGQFGTRLLGGKDHASPRYIFTYLNNLTRYIFREEDDCILEYLNEDGISIEPKTYYPIIPMILVNGTEGIGTGFSTNIPPYNPLDIVDNIKRLMKNKPVKPMIPWYNNFKGTIKQSDNTIYINGNYDIIDDNTICINELPIGMDTTKYKNYLESIEINNGNNKEIITGFRDNNTETDVNFIVSFPNKKLEKGISNDTMNNKLKLEKTLKINNMHLFTNDNKIKKFNNVEEILIEFYNIRLPLYEKRRNIIIEKLEYNLLIIENRVKFIDYKINKKIIIDNQKKNDIIKNLEKYKFSKLKLLNDKIECYDYLFKMDILTFSKEKIDELNKLYELKLNELNKYKKLTAKDIWNNELNLFIKKYK